MGTWLVIGALIGVALLIGMNWVIAEGKKQWTDNPEFREQKLAEIFDGSMQVTTTLTSGTLGLDDMVKEANARGYAFVSQSKLNYEATSVVFEKRDG